MRKRAFAVVAVLAGLLVPAASQAAPEPWYTYWGIGWASNSYPEEVEDVLDAAKDAGFDHVAVCLDLLGFYWPLPQQPTLIGGFVLNAVGDRYERSGDWVQFNSYLLSVSAMKFLGPEAGTGPFLRGDVGMAWYSVEDSEDLSSTSDAGYGALLGGGYGLAISQGTRMLLNANYALRHAEGDDVGSFNLSLGWLF